MPHAATPGLPRDFLRPCVLLLLRDRPTHGYDLLDRIGEFGFDDTDPGGLYRVLRRMEEQGLVRSGWHRSDHGPRRRSYELTAKGLAELRERARDFAASERRIDAFLSRYSEVFRRPDGAAAHNGAGAERFLA